ncbi:MAG: hypothetical protein E7E68_10560, partial [Staphylococcus sp.]|nr:hypothetical protein [Staphylococcus sp.]
MSINRLLSPFILKKGSQNEYNQELQRHSDAERVAFVDETFVEPSYGKDGKLHPGYYSIAAVVVEADDIAKFREDFA